MSDADGLLMPEAPHPPKSWRLLATAALMLAAVSLFISVLLFRSVETTTDRTNSSLCTFRADVQQRAESTRRFLADHPHGIPGIPAGTLRQSLDAQRRTVKALRSLNCPPRSE